MQKYFRKKFIWLIVAAVVLIAFLLIFSIKIHLDLGMILIGIAAILLTFALLLIVQHLLKPTKTVTVITKVSFISPPVILQTMRTYKLRIEMSHRIEEKGKVDDHNLDTLELSFNKSDHPDIYDYCFGIVSEVLDKNLISAEKKYPKAKIIAGPLSLPKEIKRLRI